MSGDCWRDQDLVVFEAMFNVPLENWTEVERLLGEGVEEGHGLAQLVRADVFLRHKQPGAAEKILERLLRQFPNGITNEPMMQGRVLLGPALFEQHKLNQARQVMTEAVRLAAPERLLRPFLSPGTALIPLLALLRHTESFTPESQQFLLNILQLLGCPDQTTDWLPQEKLVLEHWGKWDSRALPWKCLNLLRVCRSPVMIDGHLTLAWR